MRRWLFAQADQSDRGRNAPLARGLLAGAGLLSTLLVSGSCLVLQNNEVVGVENYPRLRRLSPVEFAQVPSVGGMCGDEPSPAMAFEVELFDEDVKQPLWGVLRLNGQPLPRGPIQIAPQPPSMTRRLDRLCIPHADFDRECSRVELIVTSDYEKAQRGMPDSDADPDFVRLSWFVLGAAGAGYETARPSDCLRLLSDGGVE
jgi:hypothetical protein